MRLVEENYIAVIYLKNEKVFIEYILITYL